MRKYCIPRITRFGSKVSRETEIRSTVSTQRRVRPSNDQSIFSKCAARLNVEIDGRKIIFIGNRLAALSHTSDRNRRREVSRKFHSSLSRKFRWKSRIRPRRGVQLVASRRRMRKPAEERSRRRENPRVT